MYIVAASPDGFPRASASSAPRHWLAQTPFGERAAARLRLKMEREERLRSALKWFETEAWTGGKLLQTSHAQEPQHRPLPLSERRAL